MITPFNIAWALSWSVFGLSLVLFALKLRHWRNAVQDLNAAKQHRGRTSATIAAAHGLLRLARMQIVVGCLWVFLATTAVIGRYNVVTPVGIRIGGRLTMSLLIIFEIIKLVLDDKTRSDIAEVLEYKKQHEL